MLFAERLAAAEPIVAGGHEVGDHVAAPGNIAILRDLSIRAFTVHPDDTIVPWLGVGMR